jgi:hypothetical protein
MWYLLNLIQQLIDAFILILRLVSEDNRLDYLKMLQDGTPGFNLAFLFLFLSIVFNGFLLFVCFKRKKISLKAVPILGFVMYLFGPLFIILNPDIQNGFFMPTNITEYFFTTLGIVFSLIPILVPILIVYKNKTAFVVR